MAKKILSEEDKAIISVRSVKESQGDLAKEYGVSQSAISKMLSKKQQRDIVKCEMSKIVAALPDILGAQLDEIKVSHKLLAKYLHPELMNANDTSIDGIDNLEDVLALRKLIQSDERELLKSMGILPTQTTNQYIQQIYNDNRNTAISKDVLRFMGLNYKDGKDIDEDVEIIDVECEDVESSDDD